MLVLIAGITGSLGQRLALNAISRGISIRGLGRDPAKLQLNIADKLESFITSTSYYDISALDQAVKGVDGIICCYSPEPVLDLDGNLILLRAAERAGVKVFIHSSWNNDWSKIKFGDFDHYDPHIAFEQQAAMTSTINPVYLFTGIFSDLLLTQYGPGAFTRVGTKGVFKYWGNGNLQRWPWSAQDDVAAWTIDILLNGEGVQEGRGGFFRFRSGEVTIDSLAEAYKRNTGNKVEVTRVGELEDLERDVARLRLEHGRASHWAYLTGSSSLIATKGGWEMKNEELTILDHVKRPRSLDECLREHLGI